MKKQLQLLATLLALLSAALFAHAGSQNDDCAACRSGKEAGCHDETASADPHADSKPERHPIKGVVRDLMPAQGGVLVKHEAIPGYMGAMTMMFKVDPATLATLAKGQTITATLVLRGDEHWLEDIKIVAP